MKNPIGAVGRWWRARGAFGPPRAERPDRARRRAVRLLAVALVVLLTSYVAIILFSRPSTPGTELRYDQFRSMLKDGRIEDATILSADGRITGTYDRGAYWIAYGNEGSPLYAHLLDDMESAQIAVLVDEQWAKGLVGPLTIALPSLVLVDALLLVIILMRGQGGEFLAFGRSGSRQIAPGEGKITFDDVAGLTEPVEELAEIRDYLADPARFLALGARVPRGVLLVGPPGCGKTLLARAVAGEAGVPFFSISGSGFVEMFQGVGAARIRDLFEQARAVAPAIIFIDELDAVGRGRSAVGVTGQEEREATLNQLLVGLDGFDSGSGIVVVAATNRPDILDSALLRPGRFDRRIVIDLPDVAGRLGILGVQCRDKPLAGNVNLELLARRTAGFSGADLAGVVNEAALLAARRRLGEIDHAVLSEAVERVVAGPERHSRLLSAREKHLIACHEAGHALVSSLTTPEDHITKISIIGRGRGAGFTWLTSAEESRVVAAPQLEARLATMLAGRVAEEVVAGVATTSAQDDIERATELARRMVCELGMSERLGPLSLRARGGVLGDGDHGFGQSQQFAMLVDEEIQGLVKLARERAVTLLQQHRATLDRVATRLAEVETLEGEELDRLLRHGVTLAVSG